MAKPPAIFLPSRLPDAYAIQALAKGLATPEAQRQAIKCIVEEISGTYAMTYDPESDRQSAFAEGRRSVGRAIVGIINSNLGAVKAADERIAARRLPKPVKGRPDNA